jgi:hypothetical protein
MVGNFLIVGDENRTLAVIPKGQSNALGTIYGSTIKAIVTGNFAFRPSFRDCQKTPGAGENEIAAAA